MKHIRSIGQSVSEKDSGNLFRIGKEIREIPGFKKKLEYILEYYYLWILGGIAAMAVLVYVLMLLFVPEKDNKLFVMFANTYAEIGDDSDFQKDFMEYAGIDSKKEETTFNNSIYFDYRKGVTGNTYYESFVTYSDANKLDAVTMDSDALAALGTSGRLLDLSSEAGKKLYEKYKDRLIYCTPKDTEYSTNPVPVGIDISDSILVTQYHAYDTDCALGISAGCEHIDEVMTFLEYILNE